MLRFGIVSQINPITVQARVSFEDDESTSFWLPILQTKTLKDKFYIMPDIGEQVVCLMDENSEDGVILGSIYSSEDIPVATYFSIFASLHVQYYIVFGILHRLKMFHIS